VKHLLVGGMDKGKWKQCAKVALYVAGLIIFLELSSSLVLNNLISTERMERFNTLFLKEPIEYGLAPHPYLSWVEGLYLNEQERYLNYLGKEWPDTIFIVALGGSTTWTGYPTYTESFLNDKLEGLNSSLRVVVFNFGVNGWTSIQSIQNYFYLLRYLPPDFVVIHHNNNDRRVLDEGMFQQSVLHLPRISKTEKGFLRNSRFYRLLRFTYALSYNPISYGTGVVLSDEPELPMAARISSFLNEEEYRVWMGHFFRVRFVPEVTLPIEMTTESLLTETYKSFIKYTRADNSTLIMTTQYLNYSKVAGVDISERESWEKESREINNIFRNVSRQHDVPLADLEEKMARADYLLIDDGVHFEEEGIRLKGELIGEAIFEILAERYNLSE